MTEQRAVRRYAHMCRMDHEQIGHNDSEHEQCPLCRAQDERDALSTELAEAKAEIERMRVDAQRWRATIGSARVRVLGSAGLNDPLSNYAHIGVELWTSYNDPEYLKVGCEADRERFTKYADFAAALIPAKEKP